MAFYRIETERLVLRPWRDGDWHGLHRTYGDAEVMGWIGAGAADLPATAAAVGRMSMHWRLLGYGMFAVEERTSGEIVGRVGLMFHPDWPLDGPKVEVGWTLERSAWGNGYATVLDLPQIFSMTRPDNVRSRGVMERCGLTKRGELDFQGWHQVHYAIDRHDWPRHDAQMRPMKIREVGDR